MHKMPLDNRVSRANHLLLSAAHSSPLNDQKLFLGVGGNIIPTC